MGYVYYLCLYIYSELNIKVDCLTTKPMLRITTNPILKTTHHLLPLRHSTPCIKYFQTTQKSYYEILGVNKKATDRQIRSQFLKKARQLHPDHNKEPKAQQQFKILKQAYQILKDPQKRYIYDSGISTDFVDQSVYSGNRDRQQDGRKYYENKWYGYVKNKYEDQRDQYYENKFYFEEDGAYLKKRWYRVLGAAVFLFGVFSYDYLRNTKLSADAEREHIKYLIQGNNEEDKKTRRLRRYIEERAKVHQVD